MLIGAAIVVAAAARVAPIFVAGAIPIYWAWLGFGWRIFDFFFLENQFSKINKLGVSGQFFIAKCDCVHLGSFKTVRIWIEENVHFDRLFSALVRNLVKCHIFHLQKYFSPL